MTEKPAALPSSPAPTKTLLDRVTRIAAIEAHYWLECDSDREPERYFHLGASAAASNICAAIARDISPEQFTEEVKLRSPVSSEKAEEVSKVEREGQK